VVNARILLKQQRRMPRDFDVPPATGGGLLQVRAWRDARCTGIKHGG
jgi:hypothetical protein